MAGHVFRWLPGELCETVSYGLQHPTRGTMAQASDRSNCGMVGAMTGSALGKVVQASRLRVHRASRPGFLAARRHQKPQPGRLRYAFAFAPTDVGGYGCFSR